MLRLGRVDEDEEDEGAFFDDSDPRQKDRHWARTENRMGELWALLGSQSSLELFRLFANSACFGGPFFQFERVSYVNG